LLRLLKGINMKKKDLKFIKFFTRKYTLLEHWLIAESMLKQNTSIPGIYYNAVMDISQKGLVGIHVLKSDLARNKQWVAKSASKNPHFAEKMLKDGLARAKRLKNLPLDLPDKIIKLSDKKIIKELNNLKNKFFDFSAYVDFTHYLGEMGVRLAKDDVKNLSEFHEYRKQVFMDFFKFFGKVVKKIAQKKKVETRGLSYISFNEIIYFLKGKMTVTEIDRLQKLRKKRYIAKNFNGREEIIADNFEKEFVNAKKNITEENIREEIKGMAINKGVVKGEVMMIDQKTPLNKIRPGKIIVTQMTSPDMTSALKKAKAIITDEGGLLCHAANIAREFGTIAIVGTKIATKVLKDGDSVEVDANKGIVKIV